MKFKRKQQGAALLLELSIVAILSAMATAAAIFAQRQELIEVKYKAEGQLLLKVRNAADTYVVNNYKELMSDTPTIAGISTPMAPTIANLASQSLISSTFLSKGLFGKDYKLILNRLPLGCSGATCINIGGYVYLNGALPNSVGLGVALSALGADGGYSDQMSPGTINGIGGANPIPNPLGNVANVLGASFGYNTGGFNQFLRRDGTLPMTGNLNMGTNKAINATGLFADVDGTSGTLNLGSNVKVGKEVGVASGLVSTGTAMIESNTAAALTIKGEAKMSGLTVTGNGVITGSMIANDSFSTYRQQWMSQLAPDISVKGSQIVNLSLNANIAKPNCSKPVADANGGSVDSTKPYSTSITGLTTGSNLNNGVAKIYAVPVAAKFSSTTNVKGTLTSVTNPDGSTTFTQTIDNSAPAEGAFDLSANDMGTYWQITYQSVNHNQDAYALIEVGCKY